MSKVFVYESDSRIQRRPGTGTKPTPAENVEMTLRLTLLDGATGDVLAPHTLATIMSIDLPRPLYAAIDAPPEPREADQHLRPESLADLGVSMIRDPSATAGATAGVKLHKLKKRLAAIELEELLNSGWYRRYDRFKDGLELDRLYEYAPGMVVVTSTPPGAFVFLDERRVGRSPGVFVADDGDLVTVQKAGYRPVQFRVPVGHSSVHADLRRTRR